MELSFGNKLATFVKGSYFFVGLIFFILGGVLFAAFSTITDFKSIVYVLNRTVEVNGVVTTIKETNTSANGEPVLNFHFSFQHNATTLEGNSYATGPMFELDEEVTIEYLPKNPSHARIKGTRTAPVPFFILLFAALFPALGLIWIWLSYKRYQRFREILRNYTLCEAALIRKEQARWFGIIPVKGTYDVEYTYSSNVGIQHNITKTPKPSKFKDTERLVYSSQYPEKSVLLKILPKSIVKKMR